MLVFVLAVVIAAIRGGIGAGGVATILNLLVGAFPVWADTIRRHSELEKEVDTRPAGAGQRTAGLE